MRRWPTVGLVLDQRRRGWANTKPPLCQRLMFSGWEHLWKKVVLFQLRNQSTFFGQTKYYIIRLRNVEIIIICICFRL